MRYPTVFAHYIKKLKDLLSKENEQTGPPLKSTRDLTLRTVTNKTKR
jgi:hypothetical protein